MMNNMDTEELRKCRKIHQNISSEEDSDCDSKYVRDSLYERYKPPPIPIDPRIHKIIDVGLSGNEESEEEQRKNEVITAGGLTKRQKKRRRQARKRYQISGQKDGDHVTNEDAKNVAPERGSRKIEAFSNILDANRKIEGITLDHSGEEPTDVEEKGIKPQDDFLGVQKREFLQQDIQKIKKDLNIAEQKHVGDNVPSYSSCLKNPQKDTPSFQFARQKEAFGLQFESQGLTKEATTGENKSEKDFLGVQKREFPQQDIQKRKTDLNIAEHKYLGKSVPSYSSCLKNPQEDTPSFQFAGQKEAFGLQFETQGLTKEATTGEDKPEDDLLGVQNGLTKRKKRRRWQARKKRQISEQKGGEHVTNEDAKNLAPERSSSNVEASSDILEANRKIEGITLDHSGQEPTDVEEKGIKPQDDLLGVQKREFLQQDIHSRKNEGNIGEYKKLGDNVASFSSWVKNPQEDASSFDLAKQKEAFIGEVLKSSENKSGKNLSASSSPDDKAMVDPPNEILEIHATKKRKRKRKKKKKSDEPNDVSLTSKIFQTTSLQSIYIQLAMFHLRLDSIIPDRMDAPYVFSSIQNYLYGLQNLNIPRSKCTLCLCTILETTSLAYASLQEAIRLRHSHLKVAQFFDTLGTAIIGSVARFNFESELKYEANSVEMFIYSSLCNILCEYTNQIMLSIGRWTGIRFPNPVFPPHVGRVIPRSYFISLAAAIRDERRTCGFAVFNCQTTLHLVVMPDLTRSHRRGNSDLHFHNKESELKIEEARSTERTRSTVNVKPISEAPGDHEEACHEVPTLNYPIDWILRRCTVNIVLVALILLFFFKHFFAVFVFCILKILSFSDLFFLLVVLLYLCAYFVVNYD